MSEFQAKVGNRTVDVLLLVHRRCVEPMFSISNAIAYARLMVTAKQPKPSPIRDVLGPSTWIHIEGSAEGKWCAREGAEVSCRARPNSLMPRLRDLQDDVSDQV